MCFNSNRRKYKPPIAITRHLQSLCLAFEMMGPIQQLLFEAWYNKEWRAAVGRMSSGESESFYTLIHRDPS